MFEPVEFGAFERLLLGEGVLGAVEGVLVFAAHAFALDDGGEAGGVGDAVFLGFGAGFEGAVEAFAGFAVAAAVDEVEDEADDDGDGENQLEMGHESGEDLLEGVHV